MDTTRAVTVIPPIITRTQFNVHNLSAKKRVAAYARVSTDTEEQLSSYSAQVDYYTRYIKANIEWEFVGVYTDEGISATNTKKRDGFNRMICDALEGKIDMIVTKSVSRFARNTVDTLTTVRKLKDKGVEVYFEKENIYTLDSKGELLITIMSSLAQEESRSISENVTWGQRKRFADGKVSLPYKKFLGYEKGANGLPKIVEKEAETVRLMYKLYLQGRTHNYIARHLTELGIPTPGGKVVWSMSTVKSILKNEKYKGDAILQKTFTVDFLTKKIKINEGEVPQYYVENSHPAIVSPEVFDLVQHEMKLRKPAGSRLTGLNCFSSKIICGACGGFYGSKQWHSATKYERTIWQCNNKRKDRSRNKCSTPHLYPEMIKMAFIEAFNQIVVNKDQLIEDYAGIIEMLTSTSTLEYRGADQRDECMVVMELIRKCVDENAHAAIDQADYQQRYDTLVARYKTAKNRLDEITNEIQTRAAKRGRITQFLDDLKQQDGLMSEFDEELWCATVESMTVTIEGGLKIRFKDGREV